MKLVEWTGATEAYDLAPSLKILDRKTKGVILHGTRIINSKLTSRKGFLMMVGTTRTLLRSNVRWGVEIVV